MRMQHQPSPASSGTDRDPAADDGHTGLCAVAAFRGAAHHSGTLTAAVTLVTHGDPGSAW